jgi:hypothetical protein
MECLSMTTAVRLRDEAAERLTNANLVEGAHDTLDELRQTLTDHPEQFEAFEAPIIDLYEATRHVRREEPRLENGSFVYRNARLEGATEFAPWRWPPQTYDAYARAVANCQRVRVLGECWGMSAASNPAEGGGLLLSGDPHDLLGPRVKAGSTGDRVHCRLGATWHEVHDFLEAHQPCKCAPNQPGFSGLTVAGSIGVGGHGSGLRLGSLESMVTQVELASVDNPTGEPIVFRRGEDGFDFAVTHLGRLGPVIGVELQMQDAFRIAEEREVRMLGVHRSWKDDLEALIAEAVELQRESDVHSAEIWIAPYQHAGEITSVLGVRRYTNDAPSTDTTRPAVLRCKALQVLGKLLSIAIVSLMPSAIKRILPGIVKQTQCKRVVLSAREGLDFGAPNENRMTAIECALSIEHGAAAVIEAFEMLDHIGHEHDRYVFSPVGIRFVGRGAEKGLSPQAGREHTMHVEVPTFDGELFQGDAVLRPIQRHLAAKFHARPHWGQRVYLLSDELRGLWPAETHAEMASLVTRLDPRGVFGNPWIDRMLNLA